MSVSTTTNHSDEPRNGQADDGQTGRFPRDCFTGNILHPVSGENGPRPCPATDDGLSGALPHGNGIVGRFAPSPTGRLHLGNIASMLVAWLAARVLGGRVLLRIEDIDLPRAVKDADKWIMDDLHWLGLDWDGEPVWQSRRLDLYEHELRKIAGLRLLGPDGEPSDERAVFPCFCSRKDLREASAPQGSDGFVIYPGTCRHFASDPTMTGSALFADPSAVPGRAGEDCVEGGACEGGACESDACEGGSPEAGLLARRHSLRLAMPRPGAPQSVQSFVDALYGPQSWDLPRDIGDVVVRRSDRLFAYQLVVVIDDLFQGVTQIVRGRDLLRSTAVQMWIRRCLLAAGEGDDYAQQYQGPVVNPSSAGLSSVPSSGTPTPQVPMYLHTPLILGTDGKRLAKRDGALEVATLREHGVPADAVIGYLAAVLGLQPGRNGLRDTKNNGSRGIQGSFAASGPLTDFEPISAADLLHSLTWESLIARLRGADGEPHDHAVDPQVVEEAVR